MEGQDRQRPQPPHALLQELGVADQTPQEIFCSLCSRGDAPPRFLMLRYGSRLLYFDSKGRDKQTGQQRGNWIEAHAVVCEHQHRTAVTVHGSDVRIDTRHIK